MQEMRTPRTGAVGRHRWRGRRAGLSAPLARLEREHVALLLATCELDSPQPGTDQRSAALDRFLLPMLMKDLGRVQHALARAAHGAYGSCELCHKLLPIRELEARPSTTLCSSCTSRVLTLSR
jgi:DnaK suppressor protein